MVTGGRRDAGHLQLGTLAAVAAILAAALPGPHLTPAKGAVPTCNAGRAVRMKGTLGPEKLNSYKLVGFKVARGVTRLTITYTYTGSETVLDLGVWDEAGPFTYKGFRGWSGSRQGRSDDLNDDGEPDQPPVVIQADEASRNYIPARVKSGTWHVELGVGNIGEDGTNYAVKVRCDRVKTGAPPAPDPVEKSHVANADPDWYFGDFHMHGYHSNLQAPNQEEFVQFARDAQLDFMPITEYQINRHWAEWGTTAAANPDLIFWPGREVITYFGHAGIIGETPGMVEYRHGFKKISMAEIQQVSVDKGALFQINHPTTFPPPFDNLCRGCVWELDDAIDYSLVDTIEVVNVGVVRPSDGFPNPFVETAIDLWEEKINQGFHIAPVGGSDDKLGPNYGVPATAVYAEQLSRPALKQAIRDGHVWIAARGVEASPHIEFSAAAGSETAIFGDTLEAATAGFTVTVTGGMGHTLWIYRDGEAVASLPISSDDFTHTFTGTAAATDNPLGSYYRIETRETVTDDPEAPGLLSTLGMPIFLKAP